LPGKTLLKILFGLVYTAGYFFLAILSLGGGHGNSYLLLPGVAWPLIFAAIFLLGRLHDSPTRAFFLGVMVAHYGVLLLFLSEYRYEDDAAWTKFHYVPFVPILWYLFGQAAIWLAFFSEIKGKVKE
jgi:hypothetical protein